MKFYKVVQKLGGGGHRQSGDLISLLSFFESRLKIGGEVFDPFEMSQDVHGPFGDGSESSGFITHQP
jgi:hypothetical protein